MALQTFGGWLPLGYPMCTGGGNISAVSILLDAASEKAAFILQAPKTGNIRKIGFLTGTVTTGATVDVRIETIDAATGAPSGTLFGTNTNVSHIINNGDDNVWLTTAALTADAAVTVGDKLAVVIVNPAGSPGNFNISRYTGMVHGGFPYAAHFTASWAKLTAFATVALEYDDGSYAYSPGMCPVLSRTNPSFGSGSTPDEIGIIFQVPFSCKVGGVLTPWRADADMTIKLYDSDGSTVLESYAADKDIDQSTSEFDHIYLFDSAPTLAINTNYRLTFLPDGAATILGFQWAVNAAGIMNALPMGSNWHRTERTDGGAWSQTTTARPLIYPLVSALDDGAGGSGGGGPLIIPCPD